jgi:hypothetical protein
MKKVPICRVCSVEVFRNGVLVTFADGKCVLFSAELLCAMLPQAQQLPENEDEDLSAGA